MSANTAQTVSSAAPGHALVFGPEVLDAQHIDRRARYARL